MGRSLVTCRAGLIGAAMSVSCGCSMFGSKPVGNPTIVPAAELRHRAHEDRARLAGEDGPGSNSKFVAGVDVGYDSWYFLPLDLMYTVSGNIYDRFSGQTPLKDVAAMEDLKSSDHRREGILKVVSYPFARKNPYVKRYQQISQEAGIDAGVRAAAIRAMNRSRDKTSVDLYVRNLESAEVAVRLEAAKALANIPTEQAIPALVKHLESDESKDVRIVCADALREFKTLDVSRALINVLGDKDFAVAWQARHSLSFMTGRDFSYNDVAWLDYLSKAKTPFL